MLFRFAASAAFSFLLCLGAAGAQTSAFTLEDAIAKAVQQHPDLQIYKYKQIGLQTNITAASNKPALRINAELENVLGSGTASGLQGAELSLSLASVLERGGKREARRALAARHLDALGLQRARAELDILAEVARRYLDVLAAQEIEKIAMLDLAQRQRTLVAATKRTQAGAAPDAVRLSADAMLTRAKVQQTRYRSTRESAWQHLALMWGEVEPSPIKQVQGQAFELPKLESFSNLRLALQKTPDLQKFADENRIREARLQLAQSQQSTDLEWSIGLRRLQADQDVGLIGAVSLPLGNARRAQADITVAQTELEALAFERESSTRALESTLAQALSQFNAAKVELEQIRENLLPKLLTAEASAEQAYRAGALSYLEWAQLQTETTHARQQQLALAFDAHRALIEVQRLTGEPMVIANSQNNSNKDAP